MPIDEIKKFIRSRSREEWIRVWTETAAGLRSWLANNGEVAALCGLITGIILVLFFRLFVFLAVVVGLLGYVVWILAEPNDDSP